MCIVCLIDYSHEVASLIFSEKKMIKMLTIHMKCQALLSPSSSAVVVICTLRVNVAVVCLFYCRFQQSFSHIATESGCGRALNAHFLEYYLTEISRAGYLT